jgi:hypothetical protein
MESGAGRRRRRREEGFFGLKASLFRKGKLYTVITATNKARRLSRPPEFIILPD